VPIRSTARGGDAVTAKDSRAGAAYRQLKAEIIRCTLMPGTLLAAQSLADRLGMSRTPVHEALKALSQEGLVRTVPRVGYIVTPASSGDIDDIFELRLDLEVLAAGLAAQRVSDEDVAGLREHREQGRRLERSGDPSDPDHLMAMMESNREFHVTIAALSGNRRLPRIVGELLDAGQRIYFLFFLPGNPRRRGDAHADIIRALAARDADAARAAMADHIREQWSGTRHGAGLRR